MTIRQAFGVLKGRGRTESKATRRRLVELSCTCIAVGRWPDSLSSEDCDCMHLNVHLEKGRKENSVS